MVEWFTTSKAYFGPNNAKGLERFLAAFYSNFFDVVLARPNFGNHIRIRVLEDGYFLRFLPFGLISGTTGHSILF